ncbi:trimeric intracellular cation channel family protein [Halomonas lysinitropha]|uniref:Glycine transporter domain-containing protein n=1 Tax=Halomonas lysinitropha TaxID=2607506 RepID=A0A5K1I2D2_9GAMM|nr:trimeric intracellular cation channel family protein [Halomonas lysinitropha]VVZ94133.1 hypothetical protein HALO32_00183 [Halomonas lysinitropha]
MAGWIYYLDLAGVVVFALSGVVLACRSSMDPFGMLVLAAATGIGGGTLRDLLLGVRPVFWINEPSYLWVILATVSLSLVGFRHIHRLSRGLLPVLDAFGLALFTVIGAHKALLLGHPNIVAVLMGLLTGVAGGMVRDILARRVPMVLRQEIYATASIAGGCTYAFLMLWASHPLAITLAITVTLTIRLSAIHWHLALPVFAWVTIPVAPRKQDRACEELRPDTTAQPRRQKARVRIIAPGKRTKHR